MKHQFIDPQNRCLAYAEYGPPGGFPILVQHDLIASIEETGLFTHLVRRGYRPICLARPGYGDSSPVVLESFASWAQLAGGLIKALDLVQFDLLGIASGAPYAYALASRFPARTRRVGILSGVPALHGEQVRAIWPYLPVNDRTQAQVEALARRLFFGDLTRAERQQPAIRDSLRNHAFGVAQDLILRSKDWGFRLAQVRAPVLMRHSKTDETVPFRTAVRTVALLPACRLSLIESGPHFSQEMLDGFLDWVWLEDGKECWERPRRVADERGLRQVLPEVVPEIEAWQLRVGDFASQAASAA